MKTLKSKIFFMLLLLVSGGSVFARINSAKPIIERKTINLDLQQFEKYLEIGNPHPLEGVYTTDDKRYIIAVIKNKEKSHDFIGVVLTADNQYWKEGELKFNLVLKENQLQGYYYQSNGKYAPVNFDLKKNEIISNLIHKIDPAEFFHQYLAKY